MIPARLHAHSGLHAPREAARVETERGHMQVWTLAPHVYASEAHGHMNRAMAQLLIDHASPLYAPLTTLYGFHNWLAMTSYDSSCRVDLTAWVMQHRSQSVLHIGTASRIVAMGVTVAKLALGDLLTVHRDIESLERALAQVPAAPRAS